MRILVVRKKKMRSHITYILFSESSQSYFIGHTSNLEQRIIAHNTAGSRYFRQAAPWLLIFHEEFRHKAAARERALRLKKEKPSFLQKLLFHHRWESRIAV